MVQLSSEQEKACSIALQKFKIRGSLYKISGKAGSGKTTFLKQLVFRATEDTDTAFLLLSPTWKALQVITSSLGELPDNVVKGTIAGAIYGKPASLLDMLICENGDKQDIYSAAKKDTLFFKKLKNINREHVMIAVDESSMMSEYQLGDLIKTYPNASILLLGDNAQLPPITGESSLKTCDFELTKVFRQAEDSLILRTANKIRDADTSNIMKILVNSGIKHIREKLLVDFAKENDHTERRVQFIVHENRSRRNINKQFHLTKDDIFDNHIISNSVVSLAGLPLISGDTLPKELFPSDLINEGRGIYQHPSRDITLDFSDLFPGRWARKPTFVNELNKRRNNVILSWDKAITGHKSQGSEFDNVAIKLDKVLRYPIGKAFVYTALTRAKKDAVIVV